MYYFINSDINPDTIYGDETPVCLSEKEIARLSDEFEQPDLMSQFHPATQEEIDEHGVYDDSTEIHQVFVAKTEEPEKAIYEEYIGFSMNDARKALEMAAYHMTADEKAKRIFYIEGYTWEHEPGMTAEEIYDQKGMDMEMGDPDIFERWSPDVAD